MQYLPQFLCHLIDAVAYKGDPTEFQEDWEAWKAEFQGYYDRECDVALSEEDGRIVEDLPHLLRELDTQVSRAFSGQGDLDALIKASVGFFAAHDSFYNERERLYFVQSAPIDRLLKAAISHLQGRASAEAVHKREVDAALAVDVLHSIFQEAREELPDALRDGSIQGFQRAQKGFQMLADHPNEIPEEVLDEVIFEVRSAGELLEHIPNLMRKFQEQVGSQIPVVGELLTALRASPEDEQLLTLFREESLPGFFDLWDRRQDGWLLDPEVAHGLLDEANVAIGEFADLSDSYPDGAEDFWGVVDQLEDLFAQFRASTLQLDELRTSPYWPEAQMLMNLLRGGTPLYAARTFSAGVKSGEAPPVIKAVAKALDEWLQEPDPVILLEAMVALRQDQELNKTTRPCASCGERIPLQAKSCPKCKTKVEEFSLSG